MMNELDQAIVAAIRSQAHMPDLFRQLTQGDIWFLVPYHPELAGESMELKPNDPLPFVQLQDAAGALVPVFSSAERADEGMEKGGVPPMQFLPAAMPALDLLGILGRAGLRATLNRSCSTGQLTLPPELLHDLADGSALHGHPIADSGPREQGTVQILDPADYPTDIVQRLFESLRKYPQFRAAWIFGLPEERRAAEGRRYQVLVLMKPRDEVAYNDFRLVAATKRAEEEDIALGLLDEDDEAAVANLYARAQPFFRACA